MCTYYVNKHKGHISVLGGGDQGKMLSLGREEPFS
jgi:hypothetical protein